MIQRKEERKKQTNKETRSVGKMLSVTILTTVCVLTCGTNYNQCVNRVLKYDFIISYSDWILIDGVQFNGYVNPDIPVSSEYSVHWSFKKKAIYIGIKICNISILRFV
jgi:hypothetical protein